MNRPIERQAANYFWEQADYWRKQGDEAYAAKMDARASEWANYGEIK